MLDRRVALAVAFAGIVFPAPVACSARSTAPPATAIAAPTARSASPSAAEPACVPLAPPLAGTLCTPTDDAGRHPALVLFGGYPGGDQLRAWARDFAGRGYVAASIAYVGVPGMPATFADVPVEIGERAVHAVASRPDVDPRRTAVLGMSKGGEYALAVASGDPEVHGVVAIVPSPFAWFGIGPRGVPTGCSWSRDGKPLPCVPADAEAGRAVGKSARPGEPVAFRGLYEGSREGHDDLVTAATFPLDRIRGPVLCLAGDDDQVWNSRAQCERAMAVLGERHHPYADRMLSFPGAGHLFLFARKGPASALNAMRAGDFDMRFGGTPEADARAATSGWEAIDDFLGRFDRL